MQTCHEGREIDAVAESRQQDVGPLVDVLDRAHGVQLEAVTPIWEEFQANPLVLQESTTCSVIAGVVASQMHLASRNQVLEVVGCVSIRMVRHHEV